MQLTEVALTKLIDHAHNVRHQVGDVTELAHSIRELGVLEPLVVAPDATALDGAVYVIIAGHRRAAAAEEAGLSTVPAIVRDDLTDEAAQIEAMLVENLHRADLTPVEEAEGYEQLQLLDPATYTVAGIARKTGRSESTVARRLQLTRLCEAEREKLQDGQLTLGQAEALIEFANDTNTYDMLAAAAGTDSWSWRIEEARRKRDADAKAAESLKKLKDAGVKIATRKQTGESYRLKLSRWADAATSKKFTAKTHANCPGHRAYIDQFSGKPAYLCADPEKHGHVEEWTLAPERSPAATGTEDNREAADGPSVDERISEGLSDVAESRFDFITALLRQPKPPADALDRITVGLFADYSRGIGAGTDADDLENAAAAIDPSLSGPFETEEDLAVAVVALDARGKLKVLLAAALLDAEAHLTYAPRWNSARWRDTWAMESMRAHVNWLVSVGYELSPVEREALALTAEEQTCRKCLCTEAEACEGGCEWVEPNLCSSCAEEASAEVEEASA